MPKSLTCRCEQKQSHQPADKHVWSSSAALQRLFLTILLEKWAESAQKSSLRRIKKPSAYIPQLWVHCIDVLMYNNRLLSPEESAQVTTSKVTSCNGILSGARVTTEWKNRSDLNRATRKHIYMERKKTVGRLLATQCLHDSGQVRVRSLNFTSLWHRFLWSVPSVPPSGLEKVFSIVSQTWMICFLSCEHHKYAHLWYHSRSETAKVLKNLW